MLSWASFLLTQLNRPGVAILSSNYLFTSESVTEGHPDKVCDQISDAILDHILNQDPKARVAAECAVSTGLVLVTGEITTTANIDFQDLVRSVITEIGYAGPKGGGFDANSCAILTAFYHAWRPRQYHRSMAFALYVCVLS